MNENFGPGEPHYAAVPEQVATVRTMWAVVRLARFDDGIVGPLRFEQAVAQAHATVLTADEGSSTVEFVVARVTWERP